MTYFWLKSKIFLKKVKAMANNKLAPTSGFANISYHILTYSNSKNVDIRKLLDV